MKRKHESDAILTTSIDCGNVDDFRDQLLEPEELVRVVKLSGQQPNLALPQDWVGIYHKSGGIVYLNRKTRICTWSRPYHIGGASVRKHNVPTAAIPCLHEFLASKKEQNTHKKRKPLDTIHDGNIGHHTGNLDNHCDDHENYLGNNGNNAKCDVKLTMDSVELQSPMIMKGENDCGTCGCVVIKDSSNIDGGKGDSGSNQCNSHGLEGGDNLVGNDSGSKSQGNQDGIDVGSQSNEDGINVGSQSTGNEDGIDVGSQSNEDGIDAGSQSNEDGIDVDSQSNEDGIDVGSQSNEDGIDVGSQSNEDGIDVGSQSSEDCIDVGSQSSQDGIDVGSQSNEDGTDVGSQSNEDGTDVGDLSLEMKEHGLYGNNLGNNESKEADGNNKMAEVNKTITSVKALENSDNDSSAAEDVSDKTETEQLEMSSVGEVADYLGKLWKFQFITREEERNLVVTDTNDMPAQKPVTLKSTQILKTIPYLVQGTKLTSKGNEKVVISPAGKSPRSLLHEYCLKVLQVKPEYTIDESGASKTPFLATVRVDGLLYGSGMAMSKKQAMTFAAQKTLEIFMPESFKKLLDVEENLKIFDSIPIEDPNVYELTTKLGLLSPNQVLNECIKRNQGVLTTGVKFDLKQGKDKQLNFTMECGKHKATGTCRSKRLGREVAAQAMLQKLHPHLKNWGSVLRIYVDEHTTQEFTKPEAPAPTTATNVNNELLSELKRKMWKVMKKKDKTPSTTGFMTNIDI
ncbi:microprocessor complex subunit DGCR8-like [Dendronephthya gigantea]|uniref:microprocessor complex subunit DGCR8-like n=1 Tax=Dendronephthya gigantea TaxID=151771 RepID=UPI00106CE3AA|nr:microprocessor complex subunit DGCR8-like [Dendronephthya gigantea]